MGGVASSGARIVVVGASELGCELGRALPKLPTGTLVVSAPLAGDTAAKTPEALTKRLEAPPTLRSAA